MIFEFVVYNGLSVAKNRLFFSKFFDKRRAKANRPEQG